MKNDFISLVKKVHTQDDYGVSRSSEEIIENIPCTVKSAGASEWFEGGRNGLNPEYKFSIRQIEYHNEQVVLYNGIRYQIYRTYIKGDNIELHTQREKGA